MNPDHTVKVSPESLKSNINKEMKSAGLFNIVTMIKRRIVLGMEAVDGFSVSILFLSDMKFIPPFFKI